MTAQANGIQGTGKPQITPEQPTIIKLDAPHAAGINMPPKGGLLPRLEAQLGSIT